MSAAEIGRIHVRCRGSRAREDEALALRSRLERTARTHLPGALDPVFSRRGERVFAERVSVLLDFDPSDYDDVTVASLWAGRVDAALGPGGSDSGDAEGVRRFASDAEFDAAALAEVAESGRLSWVFAELGCGEGAVRAAEVLDALARLGRRRAGAVAALIVSRPELARALFDRLTAAERMNAVAVFERAVLGAAAGHEPQPAWENGATAETAAARERDRTEPSAAAADRRTTETAASFPAWQCAFADLARTAPRPVPDTPSLRLEPEHRSLDRPEAPGETLQGGLHEDRPEADDVEPRRDDDPSEDADAREGWWTRVAGLAFLYPWLVEYLDETATEEPAVADRLWALARLVDPEDESLVADPFVRLLAGDDLERPTEPVRPAEPEEFDAPAERVLASFAAELPGFDESTPMFVRAHFLARGGLLEPLEDGFRLLLEPAPLDPILDLLPYPVEAFQLPWSQTVTVRRRERDARA